MGIVANLANRKFLGIDKEIDFLEISKNRKLENENPETKKILQGNLSLKSFKIKID